MPKSLLIFRSIGVFIGINLAFWILTGYHIWGFIPQDSPRMGALVICAALTILVWTILELWCYVDRHDNIS